MKRVVRKLAKSYIYVGMLFGSIIWGSYLASFTYIGGMIGCGDAEANYQSRASGMLFVQSIAAVAAGTRIVWWGPSLAIWATTSNSYTFGKWLAPGCYTQTVTKPKPRDS